MISVIINISINNDNPPTHSQDRSEVDVDVIQVSGGNNGQACNGEIMNGQVMGK